MHFYPGALEYLMHYGPDLTKKQARVALQKAENTSFLPFLEKAPGLDQWDGGGTRVPSIAHPTGPQSHRDSWRPHQDQPNINTTDTVLPRRSEHLSASFLSRQVI